MDLKKPALLEFHFSPTPEDYVTTLRDFSFHDRRTWLVMAAWLVVTLVIVYFFLRGTFGQGVFPGALVFILPLYFLYNFFTGPDRIGRQVKGNPIYISEVSWRVNEKGVRIQNREEELDLPWSAFSQAREITDHFLLFQKDNPRIFQFVPKRVFENPQQEEAFREFLNDHIQ